MTMAIEQESGITIFAAAGWVEEIEASHNTSKWAGEQAEAAFLNKAISLGLNVAKPWGDSERYDFIVDSGRRLLRVQVKSTQYLREYNRFRITPGAGGVLYTNKDIDFVVVYIVPLDLWYVIPVNAFTNRTTLRFYPRTNNSRGSLEKYREAWWRLQGRKVSIAANQLSSRAESRDLACIVSGGKSVTAKRRKNAAHGVSRG